MKKWYTSSGENSDVVTSTRIRLARNIGEYPFPVRLDTSSKKAVCEKIRDAFFGGNAFMDKEFAYIEMASLSETEAVALAEKHLISPEFAAEREGRALILSKDESVSVMLCEEDHIRIQVMSAGLDMEKTFETADRIDTLLDSALGFAFDEKLGYLTQCPTNLGTGMRASVMLHLPALTACSQIGKLAATVSKLGLTIRGAYGEGSEARGDFYQLSNQVTLGISEKAAMDNLKSIAMQIVERERNLRKDMICSAEIQDKIFRAYGILKNARLLSGDEFMELISLVRLGANEKLIGITEENIGEVIAASQPAALILSKGENAEIKQRDISRAELVRTRLG